MACRNVVLYQHLLASEAATYTPTSERAQYEATNMGVRNYSTPWRTANATGEHSVEVAFGLLSTFEVNTVYLGNLNVRSTGILKLQGDAAQNWAAPDFEHTFDLSSLGEFPLHNHVYVELPETKSYPFWRLVIDDDGNPDGHYQVGEWVMGMRVDLIENFTSVFDVSFDRNNITLTTEGLQIYSYARAFRRTWPLEWVPSTEALKDQFVALEWAVKGTHFPFVFVPDGDASGPVDAWFVRMTNEFVWKITSPLVYEVMVTLQEEGRGVNLAAP